MGIHLVISLLITGLLSLVMLLALGALRRANVAGIKQWIMANAMAAVALPLFALRGMIPDLFSVQLANALHVASGASMLAGYFFYFGRPLPRTAISVAAIMAWCGITFYHSVWDNLSARVVISSGFHSCITLAIVWLVTNMSRGRKRSYIEHFAICSALVVAFGHVTRVVIYAMQIPDQLIFLDPSLWNTTFLAFGTLAMPMLTMGAVLIVYDGLVTRAVDRANRDFLTGAWSRRAFFDLAEREHANALRYGNPLSLIIFDVDHFKQINDTLGHEAGDRVLTEIVLRVAQAIRQIDYCARIGGEEFAVLLPNTQASQALTVAERLRTAVCNELFSVAPPNVSGKAIPVSISIGFATMCGTETLSQLLRRCDAALYEAKRSGRNRIVEADPPHEIASEGALAS